MNRMLSSKLDWEDRLMDGRHSNFIDMLKGIGIGLVVIGHSGFAYSNIIYLFHMALFFIVSGYCYKEKKISMGSWAKKKLKPLWIPNFVSVLIVCLMTNVLLSLHIVSVDAYPPFTLKNFIVCVIKAFLFSGGSQLLGANWFFRTLFWGLLLYEITNRLLLRLNKNKWVLVFTICLVFLMAGWGFTRQLGHGMYFNLLSVPILLEMGRFIRSKDLINRYKNKRYTVACSFCFFVGLVILSKFGSITMNYNVIVNPLFFLACSSLGFFLCAGIADFVLRHSGKIGVFTIYMGKNSLIIMLLHFISFKVITLLQIVLSGDSIEKLTSYPVYVSSNGWWIAYSIAGIGIPCLLAMLWGKLSLLSWDTNNDCR